MTDAAQATPQPAAPDAFISTSQAAEALAQRRAGGDTKDPVREAARTLGQRGAQARQERQAQAQTAQELPEEEEEQQTVDNPEQGTPGDLSVEQAQSTETEAGEGEPSEGETIDLGDGVKVTRDFVKEGLLRQADYTRKTQAVAERAKALDARETQALSQLDQVVQVFAQKIGQPKTLKQLLADDPANALERFADQEENQRSLAIATEVRNRHQAEATQRTQAERDAYLAEKYNTAWSDPAKRDQDYTALTTYGLKLGAHPDEMRQLNKPWMIQVLDKAAKFDAIQAQKGKVTTALNGKPPVIRPGAKVSASAAKQSQVQAAQQRAKSSGTLADAVALLQSRRAASG